MGAGAASPAGGITIIPAARRRPYHNIEDSARLGLEPKSVLLVVVKSGYLSPELAPIANPNLMALTEGVVNLDIRGLTNRRRMRPAFPFDRDFEYQPKARFSKRWGRLTGFRGHWFAAFKFLPRGLPISWIRHLVVAAINANISDRQGRAGFDVNNHLAGWDKNHSDGRSGWDYTAVSPRVQPSGPVGVTVTDAAGNTTTTPPVGYKDVTPPATPPLEIKDANGEGKPEASGMAEPGSTVSIAWPNGSATSVTAGADGYYGCHR
jgi:hypothetical protein